MNDLIALGYTPLWYIESDGTQYIDTGFKPNNNTRVVLDVDLPAQSSYPMAMFGGRNGSATSSGSFVMWIFSSTTLRTDFNTNNLSIEVSPVGRFLIDKNKNATSVNGTTYTNTSSTFQTNYNFGLFGQIDVDGVDARMAAMKLYSCQIYDNGTLIRDYVPAKNSDGVCGLYDKVNDVFYASATDSGFTGFVMGSNDMPLGYTKCEYIESDGTNYIDTGFAPNQDTKVEMAASIFAFDGDQYLYGAKDTGSTKSYVCAFSDSAMVFGYASQFPSEAYILNSGEKFYITQDKNIGYINGVAVTEAAATEFQSPVSLYLCARNNEGTLSKLTKVRIYSCKIYDNGTLIRDYIPCQTDKDVYGLWDDVNKEFVAEIKTEPITPTYTWTIVEGFSSSLSHAFAIDGVVYYISGNGHNSYSRVRCTFNGVTSITFNCVYYGESDYDYLTIGNLDSICTRDTYGTSLKGNSGTAKIITFNCDNGTHYVEFCYSKDGSMTEGLDRGEVYIRNVVKETSTGHNPFTGKWIENKELKVSTQEFRYRLMVGLESGVNTPDYATIDEYGVAIMDINGNFYPNAASWQAAGSPTVNGIAVSDGTHRFCIAKDVVVKVCSNASLAPDAEYWGAWGTLVNEVTTGEALAIARADFNGIENTDAIVANVTSSDGYFTKAPWSAAGLCRQFTFPNGAKGYLGAGGEWQMVSDVRNNVNLLLTAIGGSTLYLTDDVSYPNYWTSTQFDENNAFFWSFYNLDVLNAWKSVGDEIHIRAFCAF